MKASNLIIALVCLTVIISGLTFYQQKKKNTALTAHNEQKFERVKKIAKKSSSAGMLLMASALNKYKKKNGKYPDKLQELYPKFISDKTFISELGWKYTQKNNSFLIQRNIKGQPVIASMGPDLKLKTKRHLVKSKIMVANAADNKKKVADMLADVPKYEVKTYKRKKIKKEEKKKAPPKNSRISVVKKELKKDEEFLYSFNNTGLYIWKAKDGTIGFSDIQYPNKNKLTIFKDKNWIEYSEKKNMK